jgi:Mg2+-importing ATPase
MTRRPIDAWTKLDERPFDFERRRVSVLAEREGERIEIVKGAPETMLALCRWRGIGPALWSRSMRHSARA